MNATATAISQLDPAFAEEWGTRFAEAWNDHEPEAIAVMCTEDVVWNDAALPAPAHGRQAVRDFAAFTFDTFPDFRLEGTDGLYISPIEPLVLCPYRMSGTLLVASGDVGSASSESSFAINGIDQWTFRGELLCHYVTYYDNADMVRQLGAASAA
jgi:SnoaL-like domain